MIRPPPNSPLFPSTPPFRPARGKPPRPPTPRARGRSTIPHRRWLRPRRRITSRSRSRKSPRARSSTPTGSPHMARILLGVSGGIAAYKALELVRLATAAGHAVRVLQTPRSQEFVGPASFAALTGAPVLVDEFERDPARGAFPGHAPPDHGPPSHLPLRAN